MDDFIRIEKAKSVSKNDIIIITKWGTDGISDVWSKGEEVRVDGTSEYSLFTMTVASRKQIVLKWADYGKGWGILDITESNIEDDIAKEVDTSVSEVLPMEEQLPEENTENTAAEEIKEEKTERKTSNAQAKAIKKYSAKFERINCRFEKGTLDRIKQTGYTSANQFIIKAVNNELSKEPIIENNIVPFPSTRGITQNIYDKISEQVFERKMFLGEEMTAEEVLNILKGYIV